MTTGENTPPVQLCCQAYEKMPSLLLGNGKVCDSANCVFLAENGSKEGGLIYNPRVCKSHQMFFCERCFTAAKKYSMLEADGNELDNFFVHLDLELLLVVLNFAEELDADDLSRMASVNWSWFMLFHAKHNIWLELAAMRMGFDRRGNLYGAKFTFVYSHFEKVHGEERCPSALIFRLNQGLLTVCPHCKYDTEMQGRRNIPLAAFQLISGKYLCMNPSCRRELQERMCDFPLVDAFHACQESVQTKVHKWIQMDTEFLLPGTNKAIEATFDYCERCGVLQENADSLEENYCMDCLEVACICVPCALCGRMPVECQCETCDTCGRCIGCEVCKKICKCKYCRTCDMPLDKCECSSDLPF